MHPVDLLLITWNRRAYAEKTLAHLLADPAEFRLYCWDNASQDGTADLIADLDDPRVAKKHFSQENLRHREPMLWFLENATSDLGGKIDDDILLPHGWIERLATALRAEPRLGLVGCWVFMPEDWDAELAEPNVMQIGDARVLPSVSRAGQSFLARIELMRGYISRPGSGPVFPIDQARMSLDGLIHGILLPPLFAHNMDDPRSEHCLMREGGEIGDCGALTARLRGFRTLAEYEAWIREDAYKRLITPYETELRRVRRMLDSSLLGRARRRYDQLAALFRSRG